MVRYLALAAALAGAADTGQFLVARRHLFRENRRRAGGTAAGMVLWSGLAVSLLMDRRIGRRTLVLASGVWLANAGLLLIHLRSSLRSPRVFLGPGLATAALATAVAASRKEG